MLSPLDKIYNKPLRKNNMQPAKSSSCLISMISENLMLERIYESEEIEFPFQGKNH
tara:strand:+ start:3010 stop:3177 length:168 start_codon:yes stop_codon:yes gene_type:complete